MFISNEYNINSIFINNISIYMGKHKSDDYKLSAVTYYLNMKKPSIRKVCRIYKCYRQSLNR